MDKLNETKNEQNGEYQYDVTAVIKAVCALDPKHSAIIKVQLQMWLTLTAI
jgi:hypothetical protein